MKNILVVFGTRPEAIKLAPFILQARQDKRFNVLVCSTGQHREMLKPLLQFFDIVPDFDLDLMKPGQTLVDISMGVMKGMQDILSKHKIDGVIVQGDTTSCFIASLVSFYNKIPVAHIEAGLRSGDIYSPFPEEFNRKGTGLIAKLHFAPTETSRLNLIHEHYPENTIHVTGNTGIDALFTVKKRLQDRPQLMEEFHRHFGFLDSTKKLVLVTVHRRESFGVPMEEIMKGLVQLSEREDLEVLIPLHMNPEVRKSAQKIFGDKATWSHQQLPEKRNKIWLCEPVDYVPFVYLMDRAHIIITDSGGIQEEAPSLGKPILVAREKTERPEAIFAGTSKLIPLEQQSFYKTASEVLDVTSIYKQMSQARNPFGDGLACERILDVMAEQL